MSLIWRGVWLCRPSTRVWGPSWSSKRSTRTWCTPSTRSSRTSFSQVLLSIFLTFFLFYWESLSVILLLFTLSGLISLYFRCGVRGEAPVAHLFSPSLPWFFVLISLAKPGFFLIPDPGNFAPAPKNLILIQFCWSGTKKENSVQNFFFFVVRWSRLRNTGPNFS